MYAPAMSVTTGVAPGIASIIPITPVAMMHITMTMPINIPAM
jgi:hypothetical protein